MIARAGRSVAGPESLAGLRTRLTVWYVVTFLLILVVLGGGLFAAVTNRFDAALDASLSKASATLAAAARERGPERAIHDLRIPDRSLLIVNNAGQPVAGPAAESWLADFARAAAAGGPLVTSHHADVPGSERILRAYARPFSAPDASRYVALAVADEVEVEDQYAALIAVGAAAAAVALVLVGVGGWIVARKSTDPVERAVAHMRRFMADTAHELRTPLAVIRGRAEVALQRPRDSTEYVESLQSIERESERLAGILNDLLVLARADVGERPIERRRVFLDDIVLDAAHAAKTLGDRRGVRLEVSDLEETPVLGDATLLRQLALILLDNAVKFSRPNEGTVRVSVRQDSGRAVLAVMDDGIGIPAEQLPQVFERFYRGDAARQRVSDGASEGAGLGLSIARWITDEHGATIRIESEYHHGTRVVVSFPAPPADGLSSS